MRDDDDVCRHSCRICGDTARYASKDGFRSARHAEEICDAGVSTRSTDMQAYLEVMHTVAQISVAATAPTEPEHAGDRSHRGTLLHSQVQYFTQLYTHFYYKQHRHTPVLATQSTASQTRSCSPPWPSPSRTLPKHNPPRPTHLPYVRKLLLTALLRRSTGIHPLNHALHPPRLLLW